MKLLPLAISSILAISAVNITSAYAEPAPRVLDVERHVIKLNTDDVDGLSVMVMDDDSRHRYTFTEDELANLDNVEAKLGNLEPETLSNVMQLIEQISQSEDGIIEIKESLFEKGDKNTKVFLVKSSDGDNKVHVDVDIEGEHARFFGDGFPPPPPRIEVFSKGDGAHGDIHKHMKWKVKRSHRGDMSKVISEMIDKAELTEEQVAQLQQQLNDKTID